MLDYRISLDASNAEIHVGASPLQFTPLVLGFRSLDWGGSDRINFCVDFDVCFVSLS